MQAVAISDRSFSVAAPTLWNALPASLRNVDSLLIFKSCLKTYLFKLAFGLWRLNYFVIVVFVNVKFFSSTYLVYFDIATCF